MQEHDVDRPWEDHPIRSLFRDLTRRGLGQLDIDDEASVAYVSNLLTSFISVDDLYPVCDSLGNRLFYLSDMVVEAHRVREPSLRRDRFKHLGDVTLFMLGLFPERFRRRRESLAREFYRLQGRCSYTTAASLARGSTERSVLRTLAAEYDRYVLGLEHVRLYIRDPFYQYMFRQFGIT